MGRKKKNSASAVKQKNNNSDSGVKQQKKKNIFDSGVKQQKKKNIFDSAVKQKKKKNDEVNDDECKGGISCHQCLHHHRPNEAIKCRVFKCKLSYGVSCLMRKYPGEDFMVKGWICPRCRGMCNCKKCLQVCNKCMKLIVQQNALEDLDVEEELNTTISSLKKKQEESNTIICKLEANVSSLKESLAHEESQNLVLEREQGSLREELQRIKDSNSSLLQQIQLQNETLKLATKHFEYQSDAMKEKEDELNATISSLKAALANEESQKSKRLEEDFMGGAPIVESDLHVNQISVLQQELAAANRRLKEMEEQERIVSELEDKLHEAENQLLDGEVLRKQLHNNMLELKGNTRVFCRVRPLHPGAELTVSYPSSLALAGRGIDLIHRGEKRAFTFDRVFTHDASQEDVFKEISELVQSAIDGFKVCIFAYGQTGSGKTYTMVGSRDDPHQKGVIPRSIEQVFQRSQALAGEGWKYTLQVSIKEIYNNHVNDLLSSKSNLEQVYTKEEVFNLLEEATNKRSVARTIMNEESSRSHFIFSLTINGQNEWTGDQVEGEINLIDLAGSEKFSASGAERESETNNINLSLYFLSLVFKALREKTKVPFENCMLTRILKQCWRGSSKTLMLINISPDPSSFAESINTLTFGSKAKLTKTRHRSGGFSVGKGTASRPKSGDSSVGKGTASQCRTGGLSVRKRLV